MTKWDSENLSAEHTQRDLGCGLVERLRDKGKTVAWFPVVEEAADRIDQLERELRVYMDAAEGHMVERMRAADKLDAEKALADRLHFALTNPESADINAVFAAYRKARGL